jgi:hypothetical protein
MANYEIEIELLNTTPEQLLEGNYSLYAFKAVSSPSEGSPLVWFKTNNFLHNMSVKWSEMYGAYIANEQKIEPNVVIEAKTEFPSVDLGDIVKIEDRGGDGQVISGGQASAITIENISGTAFVTGISQQNSDGKNTALCAFPLHGHGSDVIIPIEKVLLMFAAAPVNTAAVVEQAFSEGLLFDMTSVKAGEPVSVKFDIDAGWDCGKQTICTNVGFEENLLPLLILPPE